MTRRKFLVLAAAMTTSAMIGDSGCKRPGARKVLVVGGSNFDISHRPIDAEVYDPDSGRFAATKGPPMKQRSFHTATLLPDGDVLIAGGAPGWVSTASAELYSVVNQTFASAKSEMTVPRDQHTATLLDNGTVLIVGGNYNLGGAVAPAPGASSSSSVYGSAKVKSFAGGSPGMLSSSEIFNPATQAFSPGAALNAPRAAHTATLLPDGTILIAGGADPKGKFARTAEIYDPRSNRSTLTGEIGVQRGSHVAVLLGDGKVLLAGGGGPNEKACRSVELYDPRAGTFRPTGEMMVGRRFLTAELLDDGRVLVAGGKDVNLVPLASAEIYDPNKGTFSSTHMMQLAWEAALATRLDDGRALMTGAIPHLRIFESQGRAQIFNPATETFSFTGSMTVRQGHTATLLAK